MLSKNDKITIFNCPRRITSFEHNYLKNFKDRLEITFSHFESFDNFDVNNDNYCYITLKYVNDNFENFHYFKVIKIINMKILVNYIYEIKNVQKVVTEYLGCFEGCSVPFVSESLSVLTSILPPTVQFLSVDDKPKNIFNKKFFDFLLNRSSRNYYVKDKDQGIEYLVLKVFNFDKTESEIRKKIILDVFEKEDPKSLISVRFKAPFVRFDNKSKPIISLEGSYREIYISHSEAKNVVNKYHNLISSFGFV